VSGRGRSTFFWISQVLTGTRTFFGGGLRTREISQSIPRVCEKLHQAARRRESRRTWTPPTRTKSNIFNGFCGLRSLTIASHETYTAFCLSPFPPGGDSMRNLSWLRAALLPALAFTTLLVASWRPEVSAQAGSQQRTLFVSALDKQDVPVTDLGPDAFIIKENGVQREVLRVSPATEPIDITVMVDNSDAAKDEITFFRSALPPFVTELATRGNTVALIGLADRPTVLVRSTTNAKQLASRAEGLFSMPSSGMTLLDGLVEVSDGLRKRDGTRAAIVAIFTDGTEFTNRYSKDVVASLKNVQASLHLVTIGTFGENSEHSARERNFVIADAPQATGGRLLTMLAPNALAMNLEKIARELSSQYKVVYARPESLVPPNTIEVTSAKEGLTVRGTPARSQKGQKGA
jgi:hypothetical protein